MGEVKHRTDKEIKHQWACRGRIDNYVRWCCRKTRKPTEPKAAEERKKKNRKNESERKKTRERRRKFSSVTSFVFVLFPFLLPEHCARVCVSVCVGVQNRER